MHMCSAYKEQKKASDLLGLELKGRRELLCKYWEPTQALKLCFVLHLSFLVFDGGVTFI